MPLTPRGLYRLKLIGELHGQLTETAFHFITSENSGYTSYTSEMNDLMDRFLQSILPKYQLFASQQWAAKTLTGITLVPAQEAFIEKRIANGTGAQSDDSLPSFCAGLLSLRTGKGGRSRIGRLYLPGVAESLSSQSRLEGVYLGLLTDFGSALTATFGNNGAYPWNRYGVFSRKLGVTRVLLPFPHLTYSSAGFTIVTNTVARPEIATMRRRKLARGQ
jgi:hypothetical protein